MTIKMYKCVKLLYLFFGIGLSSPMDPRAINLAIESSFYIDPKDVDNNNSLLDKVKHFIDKLQNTIDPKQASLRRTTQKDILTEFLTELGIMVMNFNDDEFSDLANDLKDVIDNKSKTPEFNQIFHDLNIQLFLKISTTEWTKTDPTKLKLEIARYVTNKDVTAFVTFFRNLNKYFTESDEKVLREIVKEFKEAKKKRDFKDVLNKAVEFIVFHKFKKADKETLMSFNNEVKKLSEHVIDKVNDTILLEMDTKDGAQNDAEKSEEKQATTEGMELDEEVQQPFVPFNDLKDKSNDGQ